MQIKKKLSSLSLFLLLGLFFSGLSEANESILILRPLGTRFVKIEREIRKKVSSILNAQILVSNTYLKPSDIAVKIEELSPRIFIIIDYQALTVYRKFQSQNSSSGGSSPAIVIISELPNKKGIGLKNTLVIKYEVPIATAIEKMEERLGRTINKTGVIYRAYLKQKILENQTFCREKNMTLASYSIANKEPNMQRRLKIHLTSLKNKDQVDAIWIPNDADFLKPELIKTVWRPFFRKTGIIAIVPNRSLLSPEKGFGSLCILPDFSNIGKQVGDMVLELKNNDYKLADLAFTIENSYKTYFGKIPAKIPAKPVAKILPSPQPVVQESTLIALTDRKQEEKIADDLKKEDSTTQVALVEPKKSTPIEPVKKEKVKKEKVKKEKVKKEKVKKEKDKLDQNIKLSSKTTEAKKKVNPSVSEEYLALVETTTTITGIDTGRETESVISEIPTITAEPAKKPFSFSLNILIIIIVLGLLVLIMLIFAIFRVRKKTKVKIPTKKSCLIIARKTKRVKYSSNKDFNVSLNKYFSKSGFQVTVARDIGTVKNVLLHYIPDVTCVDWQFEINIRSTLQQMFSERALVSSIFIIFYNTVDSFNLRKEINFAHTHYLGTSFTIETLIEILAPLHNENTEMQLDSDMENYLEGKITNYNLVEIFQLLNSEKRTGCLIIECDDPIGMVFFDKGKIIYAVAQNASGKDAVFKLLKLNQGAFRFILNKVPISTNMNDDIFQILMEWTTQMDESTANDIAAANTNTKPIDDK